MKTLPDGLQAHLDSGVTTLCWCWKLTRRDGVQFGFTDHDRDLSWGGIAYEAAAGFTASDLESSVGLSVDNLDVTGALQSDRLSEDDLDAGRFDHARVEIFRVNWADTSQSVLMRTGHLGEVRRTDGAFTAEVRGLAEELQQKSGRTFQFTCDADLGDQRCRIDTSNPVYSTSGTVIAATDDHRFTTQVLADYPSGWFDSGHLTWTGGANVGLSAEVRGTHGDTLALWLAAPGPIQAGDSFTLTCGCDKHFTTCRERFDNALNFRGFPHIPGNDYITSYPTRTDGTHNGAPMTSGDSR